jgi:predicted MFS family arabinose efflux permease
VIGGLQIAGTVTTALGLPIGGVLVSAFGWRTTFLVNIPFALAALVMVMMWIPRDAPLEAARGFKQIAGRIDLTGIVGFAAAMSALLGFLFSLPQPKWPLMIAGVLFGAGLVAWELRTSRPFVDVRLLATNGALCRTYVRFAMLTLCAYSVIYGLSQWLQAAHGIAPGEAGLLLFPMSIVSMLITRPVSKRNLVRGPLIVASAAAIAGSIGIAFLGSQSAVVWIVAITVAFGITLGTGSISNQLVLYAAVPAAQIGTASGLFRTFGYIGSIASSAMIGVTFRNTVSDGGLHVIGAIMAVVSIAALALTLADRSLPGSASPALVPTAPVQKAS